MVVHGLLQLYAMQLSTVCYLQSSGLEEMGILIDRIKLLDGLVSAPRLIWCSG